MARNLIEDDYYVSQGGKIPLKWTAPEALVYHKYSTASDMWSYGCVLYELWSLVHKPFESMANQEVCMTPILVTQAYCPKTLALVYSSMLNIIC